MAELKKLPRQILETNRTPSFDALINAKTPSEAIGETSSALSQSVAEIVKTNNELEKKSLLTNSATDLTRMANEFLANPNLDSDHLPQFQKQAEAITQGYLLNANPAYAKSLEQGLNSQVTAMTTKVAYKAEKNSFKRRRDLVSADLDQNKELAVLAVDQGDMESANKYLENAKSLSEEFVKLGGDKTQVRKMVSDIDSSVIAAVAIKKLRNTTSVSEANQILEQVVNLENTPTYDQSVDKVFKYWNQRKQYLLAGSSVSEAIMNAQVDPETGKAVNRHKNFNLDTTLANDVVEQTAQNRAALNDYVAASGQPPEVAGSVGYFSPEDIQEGETPSEVLNRNVVNSMEEGVAREPTLQEYAVATAQIGAKNASYVTDAATSRLLEGNGEQADEAFVAVEYMKSKDPNLFQLQGEAGAIFSAYSLLRENGLGTPDEMIEKAREIVQKNKNKDLEIHKNNFLARYSSVKGAPGNEGKKYNNLAKAMKSVSISPDRASDQTVKDFFDIFQANMVEANGHEPTALEYTRIEMSKTHKADKFGRVASGNVSSSFFRPVGDVLSLPLPFTELFLGHSKSDFEINRNSVTALNPGMTETQIQNQIQQQLVVGMQNGKNIILPDSYLKIMGATEGELAESNQAFPPPGWSPERHNLDASLYLKTTVGESIVEGRMYLKENKYTTQNDLGVSVYEVYIQDRMGFDHAVKDESSPTGVFMVRINPLDKFVPEVSAKLNEENMDEMVAKNLKIRSQELYPFASESVKAFGKRSRYRNDLQRQIDEENKIRKNLGLGEKPPPVDADIPGDDAEAVPSSPAPVKEEPKKTESKSKETLSPKEQSVKSINSASKAVGTDESAMKVIAQLESSMNPNAKSKASSASGLFQFLDGTWKDMVEKYGKKYGITIDMKNDPDASATMGAIHIREIQSSLSSFLGREPTLRETYLGHFAGISGAKKAIKAFQDNPNGPSSNGFSAKAIKANPSLLKGTMAQVMKRLDDKINKARKDGQD